jgi:hypothetical protein
MMFRYSIPQLVFENKDVINRLLEGIYQFEDKPPEFGTSMTPD